MNKPNSISEYSEILEDIKKQMKLKYSNSLLLKSDIENYIKSETLYYIKSRYGFFTIIKYPKFSKAYYNISTFEDFPEELKTDYVLIDIVDRKSVGRMTQQVDELMRIGYDRYCTNEEMMLKDFDIDKFCDLSGKLQMITEYELDDLSRLRELWQRNLDQNNIDLPSLHEMSTPSESSKIFVFKDQNNTLIGGLQVIELNGKYLISHVVVSEDFQGNGYGKSMLSDVISYYGSSTYILWVENMNIPAKKLYEHFGFNYTDKISIQMKYKGVL